MGTRGEAGSGSPEPHATTRGGMVSQPFQERRKLIPHLSWETTATKADRPGQQNAARRRTGCVRGEPGAFKHASWELPHHPEIWGEDQGWR